jgi:hypothetical protein
MVLAYAGTPSKVTITAAGLLHLMSAKRLPKMNQNTMLVGAAGERTWSIFDVEKVEDFEENPVKNP